MINIFEVKETNNMVEHENLDVRTITIGISLLSCIDSDLKKLNENIYNRITSVAKDLAKVAGEIEAEYGIPIVNKRISVTPIALIGGAACKTPEDFATIADTMDRAAEAIGADLIGGYSALVSKGMTKADEMRKMAAQNKKTKTEKVDDYEETLNKTYAKFICTVEDSANKGISKGYAAEIPRMLVPGKYTFEWKNKGLFTDYYVAKMTSLGERFLKDFKAKAEKDGFQIEYKLMYSGVEHTFGEKIFKKKNSAGYVYTPTVQVFYRL